MHIIDENEMPAPDTIVNCKNGGPIAAMFFYAAAEQDLGDIASEHGFETFLIAMEDHVDEETMERWYNGDQSVMNEWIPTREGWVLGGKFDNEDGPIAIFIKPSAALAERLAKIGQQVA